MRVLEASSLLDISAEACWALRLDTGFDAFCASKDKSRFELTCWTDSTDGDGNACVQTRAVVTSLEGALPKALQNVFGVQTRTHRTRAPTIRPHPRWVLVRFRTAPPPAGFRGMQCDVTSTWTRELFDVDHPACFESRPRPFKTPWIRGRCWLLTRGAASCESFYRVEVDVKVMDG